MAPTLRFRRLKHGAPKKLKLLPDDLGRRRHTPGLFLIVVAIGGFIAVFWLGWRPWL